MEGEIDGLIDRYFSHPQGKSRDNVYKLSDGPDSSCDPPNKYYQSIEALRMAAHQTVSHLRLGYSHSFMYLVRITA